MAVPEIRRGAHANAGAHSPSPCAVPRAACLSLGATPGTEPAFRQTSGLGAKTAAKLSITGLGIV